MRKLFTLDYVRGLKTMLPHETSGALNNIGNGTIIIRYGGWKIPVTVKKYLLCAGWRKFINRAKITSGTTILAAYSGDRFVSLLKFRRGMGKKSPWDLNVDVFDVDSRLVEEDELPENAVTESFRSSYYPRYMSLFFARPSGVCVYEQRNYQYLRIPLNLAQHLRLNRCREVDIRSGDKVFANVVVGAGYFRGFARRTLVEECQLDIGFKLFFFVNLQEEFEMIVIGDDNVEAVYPWARSYYKLL